jgi:tetratricopeptide (TPR) repeat protein
MTEELNDDSDMLQAEDIGEAALATVAEAIASVENEIDSEPTPQHKPSPTNIIPELDDVEDPEEMVQVLLTVGEERSRRADVKGALAAFNKAIALDPSCDMAWFNRGVLLEAQQDARGARQSFQICLDLNEEHAPATANMAILLERIGDLEGAYDMAERALGFYPGHPALTELQTRCKDSGISVAMEAMQPSVQVTQNVDMKVVEEVAQKAGIENPEILLQEAVHHDHDDDSTLTEDELESAAEVVVAQQAVIGETQPAEEDAPGSQSQEVAPLEEPVLDLEAMVEQATDLLKNGQPKDALGILKPHLKTEAAQHAGAWRIAGGAMARLELDNHAIAAMTHAQNLEPSHARGWFNLGSIQQRSGQVNEAFASYQRAVDADPTYLKAAEKMLHLSQENGQIERYLETARTLLNIDENHEVRSAFVTMLLQLAQGESDVLEQTAGLPPTLPAGPEMAKEALQYMDDAPSAERATALSLSHLHSDAVLMWKSLIQKEPSDGSHWTGLARALEQAGDLETASKCHAKAAALAGGDAPPTVQSVHDPAVVLDETTHGAPANAGNDFSGTNPSNSDDRDTPASAQSLDVEPSAQNILLSPSPRNDPEPQPQPKPEVDLAKAALDAAQAVSANTPQHTGSRAIANQEVAWFNQGIQLIEGKKYREALSCFDKALPAFAGNDDMIIRILNSRGNAYYLMEEYPKCVESYHQAMLIRPTEVRGDTLYNMGTAYSMMQRYRDAVKCFEQAIPRGLSDEAVRSAKDQIRRCNILQKALDKKKKK